MSHKPLRSADSGMSEIYSDSRNDRTVGKLEQPRCSRQMPASPMDKAQDFRARMQQDMRRVISDHATL